MCPNNVPFILYPLAPRAQEPIPDRLPSGSLPDTQIPIHFESPFGHVYDVQIPNMLEIVSSEAETLSLLVSTPVEPYICDVPGNMEAMFSHVGGGPFWGYVRQCGNYIGPR